MRNRGWGIRIALVAALAALLGGAVWGGLTWLDRDAREARAAADRVAAGLAAARFEPGVVTSEGGAPDLAALVTGMGGSAHAVTVVSMAEPDGDSALATLRHVWTLPGVDTPWSYETPLRLRKTDGTWAGEWDPASLAPGLTAGESLRIRRQQATRADIVDATGRPIVEAREVQRIGIDKTKVSSAVAAASATALAEALGITVDTYVTKVQQAGPRAFVEALTARVGSSEEVAARDLTAPGVFLVADSIPLAPTSTFARPILGTVGDATAEIVEKSEGRVVAGDSVGMGGLQAAYDTRLSGTPGYSVVATGGEQERPLLTTESTPGQPLSLTLDISTQTAAEAVLADVVPAAAVVAIRPSTGAVLAAASGPGSKGVSTATQGRYAPGSTFKTVSALALLRSGLTPASQVECTPTVTVDGRSFKNVDGFPTSALGSVPFSTAFANSCNTAFISAGESLDPKALPDAAAALGLTAKPPLGMSAFLGSVPEPQPGTDEAASLIGQSKVLASPLGMATVAASIAAGKPVTPSLVLDPATETPETSETPAAPVTAAEAAQLKALMRGVVEEGSADFLADVPGDPVAAKTGTAEFGEAGALREHAWMIAIQGDLAVAVFIGEGEGGATTAGPILERFLRAVA